MTDYLDDFSTRNVKSTCWLVFGSFWLVFVFFLRKSLPPQGEPRPGHRTNQLIIHLRQWQSKQQVISTTCG